MNNFKKIGLTALAGSLVMTSVNAVEYTVSGNAKVEWATQDVTNGTVGGGVNGRGVGVNTDLTFSASGELDNGYTIGFVQVLDTNGALSNTSSQVTMGMGSFGTLQVNNKFGSKANGIDDVMPAAYNETWDGLALTTDNPSFFGSSTANGSIDYRIPAQEIAGATINASYTHDGASDAGPAAAGGVTATTVSGNAMTLEIAHESGLSIGGGTETVDNGGTLGGDEENVTAYVKFAMGPITVGMQEAYQDSANGGQDNEADFWGVAYTAGDISISYGESTLATVETGVTAAVETELESLQAAYTMGAMTISAAMSETGNAGGTVGQSYEENRLSVAFAF
jgi:outer membrane protein OmpU